MSPADSHLGPQANMAAEDVAAVLEADVASKEPSSDEGALCFEVSAVSGQSGTVKTHGSAPLQEVLATIEGLIGVPANSQQWLVGCNEVSLQQGMTLADTMLHHGDRITVVHSGFVPLVDLPDSFDLKLTSVRQRLQSWYSSSFTVIYKIRAKLAEGFMEFEPWRKNDHDKYVYDSDAGTVSKHTSHWMAGSKESTHELNGKGPLGDLVDGWRAPAKRVQQDSSLVWRRTDSDACCGTEEGAGPHRFDRHDDEKQDHPNYSALPGWFIAPSEDCIELQVNIPIPLFGKKICRLLIDRDGAPLRAALCGCKVGAMHEDIEEFDVSLRSLMI